MNISMDNDARDSHLCTSDSEVWKSLHPGRTPWDFERAVIIHVHNQRLLINYFMMPLTFPFWKWTTRTESASWLLMFIPCGWMLQISRYWLAAMVPFSEPQSVLILTSPLFTCNLYFCLSTRPIMREPKSWQCPPRSNQMAQIIASVEE